MSRWAVLIVAVVFLTAAPVYAVDVPATDAYTVEGEPSTMGTVVFEVLPGIWFEGSAEELGLVVNYLLFVRSVNEFLDWHWRCVRHTCS